MSATAGEMNLKAEVLLRIDGHEELHNIGTIDIPINLTFGNKPNLPGHKPGYRGIEVNIDETGLSRNVEEAANKFRATRGSVL